MQNQDNNLNSVQNSSRFLATTLHEIRTPIQTIIGSVELLNETRLDREQKEYIRQIQFSSEALLSLANNILDYTKINNNDFKLEDTPFNLIEVIDKTTDLISIEAFNKGLEIVTDISSSVSEFIMGDPIRVQQILLNIVKNAVKFTSKGYIVVSVSIDGNDLLFKVTDSGIGVSKEAQKNIFKAYYQADASTTRKYGGTGLGLSICKSLITLMNGTIGITDNPNGGSIFYFKLPYRPLIDGALNKYEVVVPARSKILVVDDSVLAQKSFVKNLNKFGVTNIVTCSNANEAIRLMKESAKNKEPFTATFIDMIMPKVDGWHLAAEINEDKEINNTKLYLMVPEGQMGGEAKMKMLNWFDGYLYKPVKRAKLFELISQSFKESFETTISETRDPGLVLHERELAKKAKEANSPENLIKLKTASIVKEHQESELANGLHVVVVEDHLVNRRLLTTFLKKFGAEILEAENGQEAVDLISMHPETDFIFMDIEMPVKNGIDATKEIRAFGFKGIIIACTANSDKDDFAHYTDAGMNDVLVKPFKSVLVREVIEKWNTALILPTAQEIATLLENHEEHEKIWNESDFMDTIDSDYGFGTQLLKDFITQSEKLINAIPQLIEDQNFEELRRTGHTIKGSSSSVSAPTLTDYGTRLNKAAKSEDIEALNLNYSALRAELVRFKAEVNNWMKKNEL